jgi:hypothetical protein
MICSNTKRTSNTLGKKEGIERNLFTPFVSELGKVILHLIPEEI